MNSHLAELLQSLIRLVYELDIVEEHVHLAWKATPMSKEASKQLIGWYKYLEHQK